MRKMGCSFNSIFFSVSNFFQKRFQNVGEFVGRHSKVLIPICLILTIGLGIGIITLDEEKDIEILYTPVNSRATQDRTKYQDVFPDSSGTYFLSYATYADPLFASMIFTAKEGNIFSNESMVEIRRHISEVKATTATFDDETLGFTDVCALRNGGCVVSGELLTTYDAVYDFLAGSLTYPDWKGNKIGGNLGDTIIVDGKVTSARRLKVTLYLRQDTNDAIKKSKAWEEKALEVMSNLKGDINDLNYVVSQSLAWELDNNSSGDITLFIITFGIMITYACIVVGGDPVSARTWAACAGILAALFGILSSLGLISLCGVKYVNIVGVVPYLIIGIGVDDMFLLMSSWADTYSDKDHSVVYRMGQTFRSAGIGITITSLTDLLAFVIGYTSPFISVQNFCIYMGVAVIFCYMYQCLFFGSCLALHGHRVDQNRHCITCRVSKSRGQMRREGKSWLTAFCCGGSRPSKRGQDERYIEKLPRIYLPKLLLNGVGYALVGLFYLGYLGVSIWGLINFKQGLELKELSSQNSYYFQHTEIDDIHFERNISLAVVFDSDTRYFQTDTINNIEQLFKDIISNENIEEESLICWWNAYRSSPVYDGTTEGNFITGLKVYLSTVPIFKNDVIFDENGSSIVATRCFFFTKSLADSNLQADMMTQVREIVDASSLKPYVFTPLFIYFEQFVTILPSTLQTVGIALAVMTVVTFVFLPHPYLVVIVFVNISSITVGIFGFLHIWGLTLSSVTMIQLIMSIGFSVDYSVHVCTAYILSDAPTRKEKTKSAFVHAASPILNATLSSFFGIIILILSESYIFQTFFKVMFTVLMFGAIHAVFFLPVLLSLIGPLSRPKTSKSANSSAMNSTDPIVPQRFRDDACYPSQSNYGNHTHAEYDNPVWFSPGSSGKFTKVHPAEIIQTTDGTHPAVVHELHPAVKKHPGGRVYQENIKYSARNMLPKEMGHLTGLNLFPGENQPRGTSRIYRSVSVDGDVYDVYTGRKSVSSLNYK